jgi:adenylate cyclase
VVVFAALAVLSALKVGQVLENHGLDFWYRLRPYAAPPKEILVVGIDEPSFQELKTAWPWPRHYHAQLIHKLKAAGARLIVFDVLFAEPSSPKEDRLLAEAIRKAGNVILATTVEFSETPKAAREIIVQPYEPFRQAARGLGLALVTPDVDGIVRRFHCYRGNGDTTLPQAVVRAYSPNLKIPPHLCGLINFTGPPGHLDTMSYSQVLEGLAPHLAERVRGKIVLIGRIVGAAPTPIADSFYTPFLPAPGTSCPGWKFTGR